MSDPIQDIMRQLFKCGTRISISPDGGIRLTGSQPSPELMEEARSNKDGLVSRMRDQQIGERQDQYRNALPFRYTVPRSCIADRHCRRYGLCTEHLDHRRCASDEHEDSWMESTENEPTPDEMVRANPAPVSPLPRYATPPGCIAPHTCAYLGVCTRFRFRQPCDLFEQPPMEETA
jgi:hypothetical protein